MQIPLASHEPSYRTENYRGVAIRVRIQAISGPVGSRWQGSYSFFTRAITGEASDRVKRDVAAKFATEAEAEEACFAAARLAVDQEIRIAEITGIGAGYQKGQEKASGSPIAR